MDNLGKITVVAKDGEARVGKAFIKLHGGVSKMFRTKSIQSLKNFVVSQKASDKSYPTIEIYFNEDKIIVVSLDSALPVGMLPVAECTIKESPEVCILQQYQNHKLSIDAMEGALLRLRDTMDVNAKTILDFCSNAIIRKLVSVNRSKDNKGNLNLSVKWESGQGDCGFPETIKFTVPVIECMDDTFTFEFDSRLELSGECNVSLSFINLNFETQLNEYKRKLIHRELKELDFPKYWGEVEIIRHTNEWLYKINGL